MKRVKVIHVITRFDKGGSSENTFLTVSGLDSSRYEVLLVKGLSLESDMGVPERKAAKDNLVSAEAKGVRVLTIPELIRRLHVFNDAKSFFSLLRIFRRERPHIVHTHTSKAGILGRWAAFFSGVPVIVHTPHGHVFWGYFSRPLSFFFRLLEKATAAVTDRIIALTDQEKTDHAEAGVAPDNKFSVVHSGVALEPFTDFHGDIPTLKEKHLLPRGATVVGTIGRLAPVKGHRYLMDAMEKVVKGRPDVYLVLTGDGDLLGELKTQAGRLGVADRVRFTGWLPDVAEILSLFDVFVFPSLNEGMGKVLVEAMAMGKPVIATRVGGIVDLVTHGKNGLLVPPADAGALAEAIESLLSNPDGSKGMGKEGRRVAGRYDAQSMVSRIDGIYVDLLRQKGIRP